VRPLQGDAVLQPRLPDGALEDAQAQLHGRAGHGMKKTMRAAHGSTAVVTDALTEQSHRF
jgi:hypothetical protein